LNKKYIILLGLLGLMQGTAFLFIKIAVTFLNPFTIVFLRVSLALPFLLLFGIYKYKNFIYIVKPKLKLLVLLSFTSIIIPFSLISWAGKFIPSGVSAIYMALIPIFVTIFEVKFRKNFTFSKSGYLGLFIGLIGVVSLFFNDFLVNLGSGLIGHILCFLSAIFYAFSVYKTKILSDIPPALIGLSILTLSSVFLLPLILFFLPSSISASKFEWFSILGLATISTAGALILMYYLIDKVGTVFTSITNYLVPLFGLLLGYLFLNEKLTPMLIPAISFILLSLYLVSNGKVISHPK